MRGAIKAAILIIALVGVAGGRAFTIAAASARELGRSDPRKAAKYRLPWFNFSETYADGAALGVAVGSTQADAMKAAEQAGLRVEPSGWGDNRAGGAELYAASDLVSTMLRQPYLSFYDPKDLKRGMTVHFRNHRVATIDVHYINSEAV